MHFEYLAYDIKEACPHEISAPFKKQVKCSILKLFDAIRGSHVVVSQNLGKLENLGQSAT